MISESSQNIFNRRFSRPKLSRQDSIFTHTSNMAVTWDPNTGKSQVNQYILAKPIGKGSFAEVFLGYDVIKKTKCAVKLVQLTKLRRIFTSKTTTGIDSLKTEIVIMKKLDHKHVVKLFEVLGDKDDDKIYIITEYMKGGSLASIMNKTKLNENKIRIYFRQMVMGLEYWHSIANICHRDIKPENMLIGEKGELKISDFGVSSIIENGNDWLTNTAGSNYYFSPELSRGSGFNGKAWDIWALGVTLYQMVHHKYPFEGKSFPELYYNIQNNEPEYKKDLDPNLLELFQGILDKDPFKRFNFDDIHKNAWLTNNGKELLEEVSEKDKIKFSKKDLDKVFNMIKVNIMRKIKFKVKKH